MNEHKFIPKKLEDYTEEEKIEIFNELYKFCKEYIDYINSDDFFSDNDYKYYAYETLMMNVIGKEFFDFYNKKVQ
jgi:hypothetical protein